MTDDIIQINQDIDLVEQIDLNVIEESSVVVTVNEEQTVNVIIEDAPTIVEEDTSEVIVIQQDDVIDVVESPIGQQGPPGSDLEEVDNSVSLGASVLVRSETDTGKEVYFTAQIVSYPQFTISASGSPASSSVYVSQSDFTITGSVTSGTLTSFSSINTNKETGTVVDNAATFTNTAYLPEGSYTGTVTASGFSLDPTPVSSTETVSLGWSRYVPAYWVVGSQPSALPAASLGVGYGSHTVSGNVGENIYLVTVNSDFRFNVGPYEIFENLVDTLTGQTDTAGTSRDFKVYKMGAIGSSGSASYTLV